MTKRLSFITLVYLISAFYGHFPAFSQDETAIQAPAEVVAEKSDSQFDEVKVEHVVIEELHLEKETEEKVEPKNDETVAEMPEKEVVEEVGSDKAESQNKATDLEAIFGNETAETPVEEPILDTNLEEVFGMDESEKTVADTEEKPAVVQEAEVVDQPADEAKEEAVFEGDKEIQAEPEAHKAMVVEDVTEDFIIEGGIEDQQQIEFVGETDTESEMVIVEGGIEQEEFKEVKKSLGFMSVIDLVKAALKQSPEIGIVSEREVQSESDIRRAEAGFYPKVDVRMDGGFAYHDPFVKPDSTLGVKGGSGDEYNATATLTQLMFDGFSTNEEIRRQEQLFESTQLQSQDVYQNIMLQVIEQYMQITYLDSARKSNQLLLDVLYDIERKVKLQTELGGSALASLQYVQSRISLAKGNMEGLEKQYRNTLRALSLQTKIEHLETAKFDFPEVPETVPESLDSAVDGALKTNVNMSIIQSDLKALEHAYQVNYGRSLPVVNSVLKANQSINVGGDVGTQDILSAKIEMSLSLYDGGVRDATAGKIRSQMLELEHRSSLLVRNINEQLYTLYNELDTIGLEYEALSEEYDSTIKLRDIYLDQVALQHNDVIQLVEAQERAHQTYMRLAEKIRDKARVYYEILRVTGDLYLYFCGEKGCERMAG